jgi:hypothetical protein|tara:strand:- start:10515 stop:10910 length:396 start_codon:yes stop_codon:yes gene_type:complete
MLRQKYIGEIKHYEVDEYFVDKIRELPIKIGFDIAKQMDEMASYLPIKDFWEQKIAGVSNATSESYFYVVEYMHQEDVPPIFLDLHEIDSDEYLDYYNQNKIIKLNDDGDKLTDEFFGEDSERRDASRYTI